MSLAGILTMGIHFIDFIFVESKKKLVKAKIYMAVRLMTNKVREEKMAFKETPRILFFFIKILNSWLLSIQDLSKFKIRTKIVFLLRTLFNFRERIFDGLIINMYQELPISLYAPPIFVINHIKKFLENMSPDLHRFFFFLQERRSLLTKSFQAQRTFPCYLIFSLISISCCMVKLMARPEDC